MITEKQIEQWKDNPKLLENICLLCHLSYSIYIIDLKEDIFLYKVLDSYNTKHNYIANIFVKDLINWIKRNKSNLIISKVIII